MSMEMNPEDQLACEESARQKEEQEQKLALAYSEVFKTGAGKFVLKDLSERCNYNNSCIRGDAVSHPDSYAVMFQEGKRAVFNHILFYVRRGKNE